MRTATKERPILFSGPMVRAIIEGRKTQTRRVVKADRHRHSVSHQGLANPASGRLVYHDGGAWDSEILGQGGGDPIACCPYGRVGDRLWVRETFVTGYDLDDYGELILTDDDGVELDEKVWYRADGKDFEWRGDDGDRVKVPWKPSIHMPRWASRITLEITDVRVEQLNGISDQDAMAEGGYKWNCGFTHTFTPDIHETPVESFRSLWEQINGKGSWDLNPWVWVVGFKVVEVKHEHKNTRTFGLLEALGGPCVSRGAQDADSATDEAAANGMGLRCTRHAGHFWSRVAGATIRIRHGRA